jgi:hypothetical protein
MKDEVHDVTIAPHCTTFVAQKADMSSEMRSIAPKNNSSRKSEIVHDESSRNLLVAEAEEGNLVQAPGFPCPLLKPGMEGIQNIIEHTKQSNEMCMRQSSDVGKAVIVAFRDGTVGVWDLPTRSQRDAGKQPENYADLRSMTAQEVALPIIMRLVTFVQVTAFAFGPATAFPKEVDKPMKLTNQIVCFDVHGFLPKEIRPSALFLPEICAVLGMHLPMEEGWV